MAWPPPVLPTNRTNADPQQDTHPADHNQISLAINDIVANVPDGCLAGYTGPGGIASAVVFQAVTFNASANGRGLYTYAPTGVTIGRTGLYNVSAYAQWAINNTGSRGVQVMNNTVAVASLTAIQPAAGSANATATPTPNVSNTMLVNAGQVISLRVYQDSGATINLLRTELSIYRFAD